MTKLTERLLQAAAIAVLIWMGINLYNNFIGSLLTAQQQSEIFKQQAISLNQQLMECKEATQ